MCGERQSYGGRHSTVEECMTAKVVTVPICEGYVFKMRQNWSLVMKKRPTFVCHLLLKIVLIVKRSFSKVPPYAFDLF